MPLPVVWHRAYEVDIGPHVFPTRKYRLVRDRLLAEGTVSGRQGDTPIADGKLAGDKLTFTVTRSFNGNEMKQTYNGTVKGDSIDFTVEGGRGPQSFTAKKAQ